MSSETRQRDMLLFGLSALAGTSGFLYKLATGDASANYAVSAAVGVAVFSVADYLFDCWLEIRGELRYYKHLDKIAKGHLIEKEYV